MKKPRRRGWMIAQEGAPHGNTTECGTTSPRSFVGEKRRASFETKKKVKNETSRRKSSVDRDQNEWLKVRTVVISLLERKWTKRKRSSTSEERRARGRCLLFRRGREEVRACAFEREGDRYIREREERKEGSRTRTVRVNGLRTTLETVLTGRRTSRYTSRKFP